MTIEGLGLEAETYHNVQEAIAALERGHPEMIFLDLALEGSEAPGCSTTYAGSAPGMACRCATGSRSRFEAKPFAAR